MAQSEGFKHITVTAADEDDVVIVAGAVEEAPEPTDVPGAAVAPESEPAAEAVPEPAPETPSAQSVPAQKPAPAAKPKKDDGYREATLEDLADHSMPLAQKITIVAAIILIIVAIAYCALR